MPDFAYDVFISYSSRDATWVSGELLPQLERRDLRVCLDKRDFRAGVPSVDEMERAVTTSRHTLLVLTPNYLKSGWAKFERLMTQTLDPDARDRRLIPLLKTPCNVPLSLEHLTRVDFTRGRTGSTSSSSSARPSAAPRPRTSPTTLSQNRPHCRPAR